MPMIIRPFELSDAEAASQLMYDTVRAVCADDYTARQLDAWIPKRMDMRVFRDSLSRSRGFVAQDGAMLGFITIEYDGYITRLFTHKDHQGEGIASALLDAGEEWAKNQGIAVLTLESSITAVPFYLAHGFEKSGKAYKIKNGVEFTNDKMVKFI